MTKGICSTAVVSAVQREVHRADENFFITQVLSLDESTRGSLMNERLLAGLTGILAGLAALLAAIGLYGMVAWSVARRTREIGIRVAWALVAGICCGRLCAMVFAPVAVGLAVGVPAVVALARLVRSLLYGAGPADLSSIVVAAVLMCMVAALAAYLPARRATKVNPVMALGFQ